MGDRVLCFQCGGGLKDWDPADSPWVEHAKWFGGCPYLAIKKGKDYINYVVHSNKEPSELSIATDGPRLDLFFFTYFSGNIKSVLRERRLLI